MIEVHPTRMELLRLKKRTALARRGHKLLKDKQDELMRQLMMLIKGIKELREKVEEEFNRTVSRFLFARAAMDPEAVEEAFLIPKKTVTLEVGKRNVMNVKAPVFEEKIEGDILAYGFATTTGELDTALLALDKVLDKIFELAEKEKTLKLLANEIEKTRRRVNALEYILIPELEETVKYITMKLSEMERSDLSRLMRIKEIVRAH
ncbi:MAG TPA: V-type ATP synthase subunit D [candidate division WOR-3 bacterium]|uniref:V-type ATP synthase subunit D n=1 Tax=candidate division WOR-3 bacterium TaxID=2052148 RepID=A0A7C0XBH1_UNCW3|nr:V-type ATP synthase subunit D [candidate division WOR-3 bacterium]